VHNAKHLHSTFGYLNPARSKEFNARKAARFRTCLS